jgi:predicted transcriptional regulator
MNFIMADAVKSEMPSVGMLEGDILKILWDAGEPQSSVQVYESMFFARRAQKREMQSPSTIAVTLSRMVEKGLLTMERGPRGGKGYYKPAWTRAEIVANVLDDVSRRLIGQPMGYLLSLLRPNEEQGQKSPEENAEQNRGLADLVQTLQRLEQEDSRPQSQA